jgi:hypothetical protein
MQHLRPGRLAILESFMTQILRVYCDSKPLCQLDDPNAVHNELLLVFKVLSTVAGHLNNS